MLVTATHEIQRCELLSRTSRLGSFSCPTTNGWAEWVCSERKLLDQEQPRLIGGGVAMLTCEAESRVLVLSHFLVRLVPPSVLGNSHFVFEFLMRNGAASQPRSLCLQKWLENLGRASAGQDRSPLRLAILWEALCAGLLVAARGGATRTSSLGAFSCLTRC